MQLCATCSCVIGDPSSGSHSSEKPQALESTVLPCNVHQICSRCSRNPRLAKSCLLCGTVQDVLGSNLTSQHRTQNEDNFVLGDEEDEDEFYDQLGEKSQLHNVKSFSPTPPPPAVFDSQNEKSSIDDQPPAYTESYGTQAPTNSSEQEKRDSTETQPGPAASGPSSSHQPQIHYVAPTDTLLGLSLLYKVDGRLLCQTNRLPLSTLSTTPQLLHTLPFLLLPPGSGPSTSSQPLISPEEERRRLVTRRFQVRTRCADYAMAKAYCDAVFQKRDKEAAYVRENQAARDQAAGLTTGFEGETTVAVRQGGELEEAIEMYELDERWERQQKGKMGSRLKSSGQVEQQVKGWSWPR